MRWPKGLFVNIVFVKGPGKNCRLLPSIYTADPRGQRGALCSTSLLIGSIRMSSVLSLLLGGRTSPTVWRPPCVWHEIKAHEYHNNQSLGVLLRPRSFVGLLHLRPTGRRPPSHLHIFGRRPPSHLHIFGSRQACLYSLRHDPRRATSSSAGTMRR